MLAPSPYAPPRTDPYAPPQAELAAPEGYRSKAGLVRFLGVCFGAYVVMEIVVGALNIGQAALMPDLETRAMLGDPAALGFSVAALLMSLAFMVVYLVTAIIYCVWLHGANRNARALGAMGLSFTPGWSVGWFFVPIANLWKPYQGVKELYQASDPDADYGSWLASPVPGTLPAWWGLWIVGNILSQVEFRMSVSGDLGLQGAAPWMSLLTVPLGIAAALLAIKVVRQIHERQEEKAARLGAARRY